MVALIERKRKRKKKTQSGPYILTAHVSGSAHLMDCGAAETQPDSFVCNSDPRVARAGAKLDPQAFRSAAVGSAAHKSQIINLRKMSCVWQRRPASVKAPESPEEEW